MSRTRAPVRQWLVEVANQRLHQGTRERPMERFQPEALRALPIIPYDHRDTVQALVHKTCGYSSTAMNTACLIATWDSGSP